MTTSSMTLHQLNQDVIVCRKCPRLVSWREEVALTKRLAYRDWEYWGKPVPGWGDERARLLLLGLAPGAHGSNRTGRPFTGDGSGHFLYAALHRTGFASQPTATSRGDGLTLSDCYISAVVRCAPPKNRPTSQEIAHCQPFLIDELALLSRVQVVLCLGQIAFEGYLRTLRDMGNNTPRTRFTHGAHIELPDGLPHLLASYHPSLQNTNTGRLTPEMFDRVLKQARELLA